MFRQVAERETRTPIVRPLVSLREFEQAEALYRSVFRYTEPSAGLNPRLLAALSRNGGSVVGAFDTSDAAVLIGFAYGFPAVDGDGLRYHYSQAAVVASAHQGRGIGRLLKLGQADVARQGGATHMRWSYDPVIARNAHFNLDVLGARGRWFVPDYYGLGTDRVVVEWTLDDPASAQRVEASPPGVPVDAPWVVPIPAEGGRMLVPIPAHVEPDDPLRSLVSDRLRSELPRLFAAGMVAVACTRAHEFVFAYEFTPR